jgi:succinate-acetate transporter protein
MDLIVFLGALLIAFLVFTWLLRVARATFSVAITIALVVLVLQLLFGVSGASLLNVLGDIWNWILNLFR